MVFAIGCGPDGTTLSKRTPTQTRYQSLPSEGPEANRPVAPNELFTGHQFNWKSDARAAFGSIVIAEEPDAPNTMAKRARVGIVLCKGASMSMVWNLLTSTEI
jgi:hypothetical protein